LLVLDEPCQGLDRDTRKKIIGLIDQVCQKTEATLLYVTHDMEELPDVITHVLTLDGGRITGCGEYKKNRQDS
jgi:molybdate transport system ATP-binding protein